MTHNIVSAGGFNFASAPVITNLDAYEKALAACPNLDLWATPKEVDFAPERMASVRDRKRGAIAEWVGTPKFSASGLNSKPSFDFNDTGYLLLGEYQIPPSFSILATIKYNSGKNFQNIFGSKTATGARVYFGFGLKTSAIRPWVDVSGADDDQLNTGTALTDGTTYVVWCSFDAPNLDLRYGINNVTPQYSKTVTQNHKAQVGSCLGGMTDQDYDFKDDVGPVLVFNRALHTAGFEKQRNAALAYLANYSGVTVTGL